MLELSLSMVAAFAAFTVYAIAGDEIRSSRSTPQPTSKKTVISSRSKGGKPAAVRTTKPVAKPKANNRKAKAIKTEQLTDSLTNTSNAILAYLSTKGSVTITNLAKELKTDKAIVAAAADKLIAEKLALSGKRGGYPAIAPKG